MKQKIDQWREFGLSSVAVNNRKTVYLIILILLIGGLTGYQNMPRESFPQIQVPEIYVNIPYPGNSPEIITDKIIKPFEKELNKLKEMSFEQREHYLRLHTRQVKKLNGRETIIEIIKEHNRIKVRAFPKTPFGQLFETSKKLTLN